MFGILEIHEDFPSRFITPRRIDVWLPPAWRTDDGRRFPVLYLHDGQNIFSPHHAFIGVDWGMDETLRSLTIRGRPLIAVGIWNTPQRLIEYLPYRPLARIVAERIAAGKMHPRESPRSDNYLRFITEELKPFIDSRYPTVTERGGERLSWDRAWERCSPCTRCASDPTCSGAPLASRRTGPPWATR